MKKPIVGVFLCSLMILSFWGCDKISSPGPKEVLKKYLDASLKERYAEAYNYISSNDKSVKPLDEYLKENNKKDSPIATVLVSSVSYKILNVTKNGETAKAEVEITLPDMGVIFRDLMGAAFASAFGNKDEKQIEQALAQKYKDAKIPTTTQTKTSDCVISIFKILPSHYSTLFDYKLGLLSHFLSVFYLFLPLFATLN